MTILKLRDFGSVLTGREFGQSTYDGLMKKRLDRPIVLDFDGVSSLGSSFADEVVPPLARGQENRIVAVNTSNVVRSCLRDVRDETKIRIIVGKLRSDGSVEEEAAL